VKRKIKTILKEGKRRDNENKVEDRERLCEIEGDGER